MRIALTSVVVVLLSTWSGCGACDPAPPSEEDGGADAGDVVRDAGEADAGFDAGFDAGLGDGGAPPGEDAGVGDDGGAPDAGPADPRCVGGNELPAPEPLPDVWVTTMADVMDEGDDQLSLREAVQQVQAGTLPPGTIIGFEPSLTGATVLEAPIQAHLPFTLVGHDENGDGAPDIWLESTGSNHFFLAPSTAASFRFRDLGFLGGGRQIEAQPQPGGDTTLVVERCAFSGVRLGSGNGAAIWAVSLFAGPTFPDLALLVRDSTFFDADTGITFVGSSQGGATSVLIERSVFENAGMAGGALQVAGVDDVVLVNTVIAGEATIASVNLSQVLDARLVNTTVIGAQPVPRLTYDATSVWLVNSVLAGPGADCEATTTSEDVSARHSFVGATDGCTFVGEGNITGTVAEAAWAQLLPLSDYGGARKSAPPRPDSPLVDRGDNALATLDGIALPSDVRGLGFPRRCDGDGDGVRTVDIGATELIPAE